MSRPFELHAEDFEKLQAAMKEYEGNVEATVNEILHGEAAELLQNSVQNLIPRSDRKGGKAHARDAKSLRAIPANLAITVTTTKSYQYLYFPDDGTNTRRHIGEQHFFKRGGEAVQDDIINRCIAKLTTNFEKGV